MDQTNREGGCQCGTVRYSLCGAPLTLYLCHCLSCQKQSSSAFGMSLRVNRRDFEIVAGEPRFWETVADSGTPKIAAFCGHCGTRLYHCRDHHSPTLNIKAGSLDDTSSLRPTGHLWTARAQSWFTIDSGQLCYSGQPDDYEALCASWLKEQANAQSG